MLPPFAAAAITWLLVITMPLALMIIPVPWSSLLRFLTSIETTAGSTFLTSCGMVIPLGRTAPEGADEFWAMVTDDDRLPLNQPPISPPMSPTVSTRTRKANARPLRRGCFGAESLVESCEVAGIGTLGQMVWRVEVRFDWSSLADEGGTRARWGLSGSAMSSGPTVLLHFKYGADDTACASA